MNTVIIQLREKLAEIQIESTRKNILYTHTIPLMYVHILEMHHKKSGKSSNNPPAVIRIPLTLSDDFPNASNT